MGFWSGHSHSPGLMFLSSKESTNHQSDRSTSCVRHTAEEARVLGTMRNAGWAGVCPASSRKGTGTAPLPASPGPVTWKEDSLDGSLTLHQAGLAPHPAPSGRKGRVSMNSCRGVTEAWDTVWDTTVKEQPLHQSKRLTISEGSHTLNLNHADQARCPSNPMGLRVHNTELCLLTGGLRDP